MTVSPANRCADPDRRPGSPRDRQAVDAIARGHARADGMPAQPRDPTTCAARPSCGAALAQSERSLSGELDAPADPARSVAARPCLAVAA
jgi:hypothetical protein